MQRRLEEKGDPSLCEAHGHQRQEALPRRQVRLLRHPRQFRPLTHHERDEKRYLAPVLMGIT